MTFLEQLQKSAGLLSTDVASVGTYNRAEASDFINGVPQNRFVGNQFQMPSLSLGSGASTYTPGAFQANYTPMATQPAPSTTSPAVSYTHLTLPTNREV